MRGCCALASSASRLLAVTLSTVIGLLDGWKADAWMSGAANWQPARAMARPASAKNRAGGTVFLLWPEAVRVGFLFLTSVRDGGPDRLAAAGPARWLGTPAV